jgi:CspA family cold shock protein
MHKGVITFFNDAKGYGFIEAEERTSRIFVHHSQISQPGYRTLREGESVAFDVREGNFGVEAVNVQRLP